MTLTAKRLSKDIDRLAFPDRQRLLSAHARALAGTPELDALLDDLHGQRTERRFARLVGLQLAYVARHHAHIERCLSGPESEVVRRALGAAVRLGLPGAALVARLPELPTALRRGLYEMVRRRKATEIADALLPEVQARFGEHEAAALLPACGSAVVAAALPDLSYAVTAWGMLGHRHPGVLLDHLDATLDTTPSVQWPHVWGRLGAGVGVAVLTEPDRVLALLARCAPHVPLPPSLSRTIGLLARRDPTRLLGVLLDPRRTGYVPGGRTLWRSLLGASDAELVGLGRVLARDRRLVSYLRTIPPGRRAAIYSGVLGERDLVASDIPVGVLDTLPATARAEEAARLLGLRTVADDPRIRLEVTARLPWDRARGPLAEATGRATAAERAEAYPLYVKAAALSRDPDTFAAMLGTLTRLKNEQDPVRQAAMTALAEAPPWLFRPAEAAQVIELVTNAAEARDSSWTTQWAVRTLLRRLIREGAASTRPELVEIGVAGMAALGGNQEWLDLSGLHESLPRGAEHQVFAALRPRIIEDTRRGRFGVALSLAAGLDRRAWPMAELQSFVDKARFGGDDQTIRTAIELWLAPPATRSERLAQVLRADRSTIVIPAVHHGIGRRRTDLLDEVFGKPHHGRFLARGVRYLPPFDRFDGWLPRQVAEYARHLASLAAEQAVLWERVDAVRRLGRLPGTVRAVRAFLEDESPPVADAALSALAWTDEPADVLGDLLTYADGNRAHIAIYAASRCARFVPPGQLGAALEPVLTGRKITARKEAARLLAMHQAPAAAAALSDAWGPDQHRDVRRALVSASQWFLSDERAWELLERAAADEHAVATALLDLNPTTIAERHRGRYAALVRAVAAAADPDTARPGLEAMPKWCRWDEAGRVLLIDVLTNLDNTATWRAALRALLADHSTTVDDDALLTVTRRLLAADSAAAGLAPGVDRDLPARQRLYALALAVRTSTHPARRAAAAAIAELLAAVPHLRRTAVELAVTAIPLDEPGPDLERLRRLAELADRPIWAWHAHHALRAAVSNVVGRLPQDRLVEVAETLAGAPTAPAAHLLAVAIADAAGEESGWPERWRTLIGGLRRHEDTDVRLAALDTFTSPE